MKGANLSGTQWSGGNLNGTNLRGADLSMITVIPPALFRSIPPCIPRGVTVAVVPNEPSPVQPGCFA
jgi:hypothetical protein